MKRGKKGIAGVLINAFLLICVAALILSGTALVRTLSEYRAGADSYARLRHAAAVRTVSPNITARDRAPTFDACDTAAESAAAMESTAAPPPAIDFGALRAINGDVAAWLRCPGTNIDYPVVQGADNSRYLRRLITGEYNRSGTLFIDSRNRAFADRNTVIYGHNMRDQSMFWTLLRYQKQAFYDGRPTMRISVPEGEYTVELFAGYIASPDDGAWKREFADDAEFEVWLGLARSRSMFDSGVQVGAGDRVVTLSTCAYNFPGAKYVVLGKLVQE